MFNVLYLFENHTCSTFYCKRKWHDFEGKGWKMQINFAIANKLGSSYLGISFIINNYPSYCFYKNNK